MIVEIPCMTCRHFRGGPGKLAVCDAFPEGIRSEVLAGEHDHRTPLPGDHGILYVPKPGTIAPKSSTAANPKEVDLGKVILNRLTKEAGPWQEELHPREPAGSPEGGRFIPAGELAEAPTEVKRAAELERAASEASDKAKKLKEKYESDHEAYRTYISQKAVEKLKELEKNPDDPEKVKLPGAMEWVDRDFALMAIEAELAASKEAMALKDIEVSSRMEFESASEEENAAVEVANDAHNKAISVLAESRWEKHLESSEAPRMDKEKFDSLKAKEKDIEGTKFLTEERRVNVEGYEEQLKKASEEKLDAISRVTEARAEYEKVFDKHVEELKAKYGSGELGKEFEAARAVYDKAKERLNYVFPEGVSDALGRRGEGVTPEDEEDAKVAYLKASNDLAVVRAELHAGAGNLSLEGENTILSKLAETTPEGKAYSEAKEAAGLAANKAQRLELKLDEAREAAANERTELLNKFAQEAGPAYFHQRAIEDPEWYENNMNDMRGAWQHIGGEGPSIIRFAAQKAFELNEGGVYDNKLGRFAKEDDYDGKPDDYRTTMWAGLMRREYEETQADIKEGRLDNLLGGLSSGSPEDDPEETWDESEKYDEDKGRQDFLESDEYSSAEYDAFQSYFEGISSSDKLNNWLSEADVDKIKAAYVDETVGAEIVKSALGDEWQDPASITDEEVRNRAFKDAKDGEAKRTRANAIEIFERDHPPNKPLVEGKPYNWYEWNEAKLKAGDDAFKEVQSRAETSFYIDEAETRERMVREYEIENAVTYWEKEQDDYDELWDWAWGQKLGHLGIGNSKRTLFEYVEEKERDDWSWDDWGDAWQSWWSDNKTEYETSAYVDAKAAYEDRKDDDKTLADASSPSRTGHVNLVRGLSRDSAGYVSNYVESWTARKSVAREFGSRETLEQSIPASRILVFQGARNWRHGGAGSMGMKEWEVLVLSQAPRWYRDWWSEARRNRERKKSYDVGRSSSDRIHSGRSRGLRKAGSPDRSGEGRRIYLIPKSLSGDPKAALKGDYWLRLQRRLVLPWERDYRERYLRMMDGLRIASTEELSLGDRKPFGLMEWSHKLRAEMEPFYYDLYRASREDYAEHSRSRRSARKAARPNVNVIEVDNLLGRLDLSLETTYNILEDVLRRGSEEGWDREELARQFDEAWDGMFGDNLRIDSIAGTETNSLVQVGRHSMMNDVEMTEWISQRDKKVRENHQIYDSLGPVPYGYNFAKAVGEGYLIRFPMDPQCEEPGEVVNCRCTDISSDEEFEGTEADLRALLADIGEPEE